MGLRSLLLDQICLYLGKLPWGRPAEAPTLQHTQCLMVSLLVSICPQEADKLHEKENLCLLIEEFGGIGKIESLQLHQNCHISQSALNIIEKHFGEVSNKGPMSWGHLWVAVLPMLSL